MTFQEFRDDVRSRRCSGLENVAVFRRVDSTNLLARRILDEFLRDNGNSPRALFLAWEQREGRGRLGRTWVSGAGLGVYATLLWPLQEPLRLHTLPLLVGVGLCRGLDPYLPRSVSLKWPNDVLVGERKLGGVLIETATDSAGRPTAIIGFGINHGHREDEMPTPHATSLRAECDELPGLANVTLALVEALVQELEHLDDASYTISAYRERSSHRLGDRLRCRLGERTVEGEFLGFDDSGHLELATAAGREVITAGEIIEG